MAFKHALVGSFLALSTVATASADYCINKDLINLGPTAYDIAIFITGTQPVTWHYDGYPGAFFTNFTVVPAAGNELLHWRKKNGVDAPIVLGELIHVGWCTAKPNNIVDMWWTNKTGGRILNSFVYQIGAHRWRNFNFGVEWTNQLQTANAAVVSNVAYALSSSPYSLDQLNRENQVLADQLVPLPGATSFSVAPGQSVGFPVDAAPGQWIVLRYSISGQDSQAQVTDYLQFQVE